MWLLRASFAKVKRRRTPQPISKLRRKLQIRFTAHAVRPESYVEINNFYTSTIYNKGAEIVRMYEKMLGKEKFREANDLYFSRNDGKAVTIDDYAKCMEDISGKDLTQFKRWYSQAGTPSVFAEGEYDEKNQTYTLKLRQTTKPTPGQDTKLPFVIPMEMGLLDGNLEQVVQ